MTRFQTFAQGLALTTVASLASLALTFWGFKRTYYLAVLIPVFMALLGLARLPPENLLLGFWGSDRRDGHGYQRRQDIRSRAPRPARSHRSPTKKAEPSGQPFRGIPEKPHSGSPLVGLPVGRIGHGLVQILRRRRQLSPVTVAGDNWL